MDGGERSVTPLASVVTQLKIKGNNDHLVRNKKVSLSMLSVKYKTCKAVFVTPNNNPHDAVVNMGCQQSRSINLPFLFLGILD